MIFGIGCDITNAERLSKDEHFLEHFVKRAFSENEIKALQQRKFADAQDKVLYVAKRFAAKEAVAKAIGSGFCNGLFLSDIEIFNNKEGRPEVTLSEKAKSILQKRASKTDFCIFLSLSDDYPYAQAMAVIEV